MRDKASVTCMRAYACGMLIIMGGSGVHQGIAVGYQDSVAGNTVSHTSACFWTRRHNGAHGGQKGAAGQTGRAACLTSWTRG